MYSIRRWLYKPKKDDNSILAQFFYADEDLNYVAAELDSFDGRKDPERCSQLVNQLRQSQDKVLNICNQIMDDIIGDQRANRDFRVKFPDDVLQENLAGQLWFGAECLAAGSSIMNREVESASMRPLAKALTRTLDNVRTLLREQCLKNPNCYSEKIKESLRVFDRLFAEFELSYVSAMVPVKTMREYDIQQNVIVLFSETLLRALKIGLISQEMVDDYDPALMFTIPRLAIVCGLLIYPEGPFNVDLDPHDMSEMFRPFQNLLYKIRDLLWTLNKNELYCLEKTLCSVEDPATLKKNTENEKLAPIDISEPETNPSLPNIEDYVEKVCLDYPSCKQFIRDFYDYNFPMMTTTTMDDQSATEEEDDDDDDDRENEEAVAVIADGDEEATEVVADSDSGGEDLTALQESLSDALTKVIDRSDTQDSGLHSDTCSNSSGNSLRGQRIDGSSVSGDTPKDSKSVEASNIVTVLLEEMVNRAVKFCDQTEAACVNQRKFDCDDRQWSQGVEMRVTTSAYSSPVHQTHPHCPERNKGYHSQPTSPSTSRCPPWFKGRSRRSRNSRISYFEANPEYSSSSCSSCQSVTSSSAWETESCSSETSSYNSDCQDDEEIALAIQAAEIATRNKARGRFRNTEDLIHRLFVCISGVADQLQTNYASDLRNILKFVFQMNCSEPMVPSMEDELPQIEENDEAVDDGRNSSNERLSVESAEEASERDVCFSPSDDPPIWVPDEFAPHCMSCNSSFTVVRRRHHCRNCGKVFCSRCSSNSVPLPRYGHAKPVRVCNHCFIFHVTPFLIQGAA